jgi:hypothetical protein
MASNTKVKTIGQGPLQVLESSILDKIEKSEKVNGLSGQVRF